MLRKFILGGIMLVAVAILVVALQRQYSHDSATTPVDDNAPVAPTDRPPLSIKKYDPVTQELIAEVTGTEIVEESADGPAVITNPKITFLRDKNNRTVVTADTGRIEGRGKNETLAGSLKGNVVLTATDVRTGEATVVHAAEMQYRGKEGEVIIPGDMDIQSPTMSVSGTDLTADGSLGAARIDRNVRLTMKTAAENALEKLTGETPTTAETPKVGATKPEPRELVITCDGALVFRRDTNRATFEKNVLAEQGPNKVRGDHMIVNFEKSAGTGGTMTVQRVIIRADGKGGVTVEGPDRRAQGDRFEYDGADGVLVFTGSPCSAVLSGGARGYRMEGGEIRFGKQRLIAPGETLPDGMTASSQKVLMTAGEAPARVISLDAVGAQEALLSGRRILFDQDARVAWVEGDAERPAHAEREGTLMNAREIRFAQKSASRAEQISGVGPGHLELVKSPGKKSTVDFGGGMEFQPDRDQAVFTGGVNMVDEGVAAKARDLAVAFARDAKGGLRMKQMTATGDVEVTGEGRTATGDRLVYSYPEAASRTFDAELTAKPGEMCRVKTDELDWRSAKLNFSGTPGAGGKGALSAKGQGAGQLSYKAKKDAFEVTYEKSGSYDDAALEAEFFGAVKVKRDDLTLNAESVTMHFEKTKAPGEDREHMDLRMMVADRNVVLVKGAPADAVTATGSRLVWYREKDAAELTGGDSPDQMAHVLQGANDLEAPVMYFMLADNQLDRVTTHRGGRLTGATRKRTGEAAGALDNMTVTWAGNGLYSKLDAKDPAVEPAGMAQVTGDVHAVSGDADVQADTLSVYLGPEAGTPDASKDALKFEVRKAVAAGSARAKMFMPEGNYYRFATGDELEWDRLNNTMVVMSESGQARVWDNSNQWRGTRLEVNKAAGGSLSAETRSGRRIVIYDTAPPPSSARDARDWEPVY